ncbi:MAG: DUF5668 domain-containing protein [Vicinamibacteria bacterium]
MSTPGAIVDPGRRDGCSEQRRVSRLIWGLALVLLGAGMTLDRLGLFEMRPYRRYWPLVLVALGLGRLLTPSDGGRAGGVWLLTAGLLLLGDTLQLLSIRDSWPLFFVVLGASMMLEPGRRSRRHRREDSQEAGHDD